MSRPDNVKTALKASAVVFLFGVTALSVVAAHQLAADKALDEASYRDMVAVRSDVMEFENSIKGHKPVASVEDAKHDILPRASADGRLHRSKITNDMLHDRNGRLYILENDHGERVLHPEGKAHPSLVVPMPASEVENK